MRRYSCLNKQTFSIDKFLIVPIRVEDKYDIMKWRNEQLYHLRQVQPLTKADQDAYFSTVVENLYLQECPGQILFSYLKGDVCIGYGGLVHINWHDQHAEISFIMDTSLEMKEFELHWSNFLTLLQKVAFEQLLFRKIFTYSFNLRPQLYVMLEKNHFKFEAVLKDHAKFENRYIDVLIHSKINAID